MRSCNVIVEPINCLYHGAQPANAPSKFCGIVIWLFWNCAIDSAFICTSSCGVSANEILLISYGIDISHSMIAPVLLKLVRGGGAVTEKNMRISIFSYRFWAICFAHNFRHDSQVHDFEINHLDRANRMSYSEMNVNNKWTLCVCVTRGGVSFCCQQSTCTLYTVRGDRSHTFALAGASAKATILCHIKWME